MSRSLDLDTVAPDDLSVVTPAQADPVTIPSSKKKKSKKTPAPTPSEVAFSEADFAPLYSILGHSKTPFSSFLVRPKVLRFIEQDSDETIILALRSHWFTNLHWILVALVAVIIPTLIPFNQFLNIFSSSFGFIFMIFWYIATFAYSFEKFLSWYFDLYIITNERVVDIDFNNLLDKKFSECNLANIEDVTSRVIGFFPTMFNYGNVLIQTAAEKNQLVFESVPNPEKVVKALRNLRERDEQLRLDGQA
ncbi:PH domain-containing protein [Candidatus Shapirobacteria bacterium]|nr:PH domain-containing protein [Candidatus Shapirobacteria bacterium]